MTNHVNGSIAYVYLSFPTTMQNKRKRSTKSHRDDNKRIFVFFFAYKFRTVHLLFNKNTNNYLSQCSRQTIWNIHFSNQIIWTQSHYYLKREMHASCMGILDIRNCIFMLSNVSAHPIFERKPKKKK